MIGLILALVAIILYVLMYRASYNWAKKNGREVPASYGYAAVGVATILVWALITVVKSCQ